MIIQRIHKLKSNANLKCNFKYDIAGFTLVELIVVIAIAAILGGIAVPYIQSYYIHYQLESATRTVFADMNKARVYSGKFNQVCTLRMPNNSNDYELLNQNNLVLRDTNNNPILVRNFKNDFKWTGITVTVNTNNVIRFNPNGTIGQDTIITVKNGAGSMEMQSGILGIFRIQ